MKTSTYCMSWFLAFFFDILKSVTVSVAWRCYGMHRPHFKVIEVSHFLFVCLLGRSLRSVVGVGESPGRTTFAVRRDDTNVVGFFWLPDVFLNPTVNTRRKCSSYPCSHLFQSERRWYQCCIDQLKLHSFVFAGEHAQSLGLFSLQADNSATDWLGGSEATRGNTTSCRSLPALVNAWPPLR